jgi:hypothetical protein
MATKKTTTLEGLASSPGTMVAQWDPSRRIALPCDVDNDTFCSREQQRERMEEGITTDRSGG